MFKKIMFTILACAAMGANANAAPPETGKLAPDFKASDVNGAEQSLSQYRGKIVVLEWHNPECPFVVKHYKSKNMQTLQKEMTDQGVVWLTINSGAEGKQGHLSADEAKKVITDDGLKASAYILDASGEIGRMYDAKTTPHMYVVDAEGILSYMGAIDDKPTFDPEDVKDAKNYVKAAIESLKAGKSPETAATRPYGCSVKYGD